MSAIELFCNATIQTTSGLPLQLQNDITDIIDLRGILSNGAANTPITINDPHGIDLQNTVLFDSTGGGVVVSDAYGLSINNGNGTTSTSVLYTNYISSLITGTANMTITAPTVIFSGNIFAQGNIVAIGSCCVSDERVKKDIEPVDEEDDLASILDMPRRVRFSYTDAFLSTSTSTRNYTYEGFIAQELEKANYNTMVNTHEKYVLKDGSVLTDFRTVKLEYAVPYLVGAVKALNKRNLELEKRNDELNQKLDMIIRMITPSPYPVNV